MRRRLLPALAVLFFASLAYAAPPGAARPGAPSGPSVEVVLASSTGAPGVDSSVVALAHRQVSRALSEHPEISVVSASAPASARLPRYTVRPNVDQVRRRTPQSVSVFMSLTFLSGGRPVLALRGRAHVDQDSAGPRPIDQAAVFGATRSCMSSFDRVALPRLRP